MPLKYITLPFHFQYPPHVVTDVVEGKAMGIHMHYNVLLMGDEVHFSRESFANLNTAYAIQKHHWFKVGTGAVET